MFSQGQLIFAGIFVVSFIVLTVYSYLKDKKMHAKFYKNTYVVLLSFLLFIAILFVIKAFLKG
jgi:quinol-cytochrome oxidoreductase complex cytochrome b subunit